MVYYLSQVTLGSLRAHTLFAHYVFVNCGTDVAECHYYVFKLNSTAAQLLQNILLCQCIGDRVFKYAVPWLCVSLRNASCLGSCP